MMFSDLHKHLYRYFWKVRYFFRYYCFNIPLFFKLFLERVKEREWTPTYVRVGSLVFTHDVGGDLFDKRLQQRIELAKTLPKFRSSAEDIQNLLFSNGKIKVLGNRVIDGHGRSYAILLAKGPEYKIEVLWNKDI